MDTIKSVGNGSVFPEISKSTFKELEFVIPEIGKIQNFNIVIKPLFDKIKANTIQINKLTDLRDDLLPKLLSGEARVKMP
jgi:type I restriction enzyme S subunit